MNEPEQRDQQSQDSGEPGERGPSLTLLYGLLALALAAAIGFALLIVWRFYRRIAH